MGCEQPLQGFCSAVWAARAESANVKHFLNGRVGEVIIVNHSQNEFNRVEYQTIYNGIINQQCCYVSTCSVIDSLSKYLIGLPSLAINLGAISSTGFVSRNNAIETINNDDNNINPSEDIGK
ncbi:hypothetical protein ACTFIY_001090 [Dictyostelium cf. discoideum]